MPLGGVVADVAAADAGPGVAAWLQTEGAGALRRSRSHPLRPHQAPSMSTSAHHLVRRVPPQSLIFGHHVIYTARARPGLHSRCRSQGGERMEASRGWPYASLVFINLGLLLALLAP